MTISLSFKVYSCLLSVLSGHFEINPENNLPKFSNCYLFFASLSLYSSVICSINFSSYPELQAKMYPFQSSHLDLSSLLVLFCLI